jgi:membrane protein implicated in regulation of membrane protease activity
VSLPLRVLVAWAIDAAALAIGAWIFSGISVAALLLLRAPLKARLSLGASRKPVDSLLGEEAVILEEVPGGGVGKVELRGAAWNARSAGGTPLGPGQRCRVERVDGLTLWVRAE